MAVDYWRRPRRTTRGITLIEILVTVSVIAMLTGLTLTVLSSMTLASEIRVTENTLRLLDTAVNEWELQSDRALTWGEDDMPPGAKYDVQGKIGGAPITEEVLVITEMLKLVMRTPASREMLTPIDEQWVYRYEAGDYPPWITSPKEKQQMDDLFDGTITILDAWGIPIYATHPGRAYTDADGPFGPDNDGTVRTYNEYKYGSAVNRRVIFVSAGPDGDYGHISAPPHSDMFLATGDNLFSSPIEE